MAPPRLRLLPRAPHAPSAPLGGQGGGDRAALDPAPAEHAGERSPEARAGRQRGSRSMNLRGSGMGSAWGSNAIPKTGPTITPELSLADERGIFKRITVDRIETFDSGATPKPGERRVMPKTVADVDLEAFRREMAATI